MSDEFTQSVYRHFRRVFSVGYDERKKRKIAARGAATSKDRDPKLLGDALNSIAEQMGWSDVLAEAELVQQWPHLVGPSLAEHTSIVEIADGVIVVQCDSTVWATELRRMRADIITRITQEHPDAGVSEISFRAPNAPSWKHGRKSVQGRGPRDTYG